MNVSFFIVSSGRAATCPPTNTTKVSGAKSFNSLAVAVAPSMFCEDADGC